jgi:hypothetical protein
MIQRFLSSSDQKKKVFLLVMGNHLLCFHVKKPGFIPLPQTLYPLIFKTLYTTLFALPQNPLNPKRRKPSLFLSVVKPSLLFDIELESSPILCLVLN